MMANFTIRPFIERNLGQAGTVQRQGPILLGFLKAVTSYCFEKEKQSCIHALTTINYCTNEHHKNRDTTPVILTKNNVWKRYCWL